MESNTEQCPVPGCENVLSDFSSLQDHLSTFHLDLSSTQCSRCDAVLGSLEKVVTHRCRDFTQQDKRKKLLMRAVSEQSTHEICIPKVITTQLTTLIEKNPGKLNEPMWIDKSLERAAVSELPLMTEEKQLGPLPKFNFRSN